MSKIAQPKSKRAKSEQRPTLPGISDRLKAVIDDLGTIKADADIDPGLQQILIEHAHANLLVATNAITRADPLDPRHPGYIITVPGDQDDRSDQWYAFKISDSLEYLKSLTKNTGDNMHFPRTDYPDVVATVPVQPANGSRGDDVPASIRQRR